MFSEMKFHFPESTQVNWHQRLPGGKEIIAKRFKDGRL